MVTLVCLAVIQGATTNGSGILPPSQYSQQPSPTSQGFFSNTTDVAGLVVGLVLIALVAALVLIRMRGRKGTGGAKTEETSEEEGEGGAGGGEEAKPEAEPSTSEATEEGAPEVENEYSEGGDLDSTLGELDKLAETSNAGPATEIEEE